MKRFRLTAAILWAGVTLFVWIFSVFGLFDLPNGLVYDLFMRLSPKHSKQESSVLLVTCRGEDLAAGNAVWLKFLKEMEELGADQIVFTFWPENVSQNFYKEAEKNGRVFFGSHFDSRGKRGGRLLPIPQVARGVSLKSGIVAPPSSEYGIHRTYPTTYSAGAGGTSSLAFEVAQQRLGPEALSRVANPFLVDFMLEGGLPEVKLSDVLSGRLIAKLVEGRAVMVGPGFSTYHPGLQTPLKPDSNDVSLLEYLGFALNTLEGDRLITEADPFICFAILAASVVVGGILVHYSGMGMALFGAAAFAVILLAADWLALVWFLYWVPVVEILIGQMLIFLVVHRNKVLQREIFVRQSMLNASHIMREKVMPGSFLSADRHWEQVINLINQMLDLERSIFLQPKKKGHHVKEIAAINCRIDDISEMRRDFQRTPYTTALQAKAPVEVHEFLNPLPEPEVQFLAPLVFAGNLEGFWAFSIKGASSDKLKMFMQTIRVFADEVATLLHNRGKWQEYQTFLENPLRKLMSLESGLELFEETDKSINLLIRRLGLMENAFDNMGSAFILYDLFGNVIQGNQRMTELLAGSGLIPYEMTAADLASKLIGKRSGRVRQVLRYVVLHNDKVTLPVSMKIGEEGEGAYVLKIRALAKEEGAVESDESTPFEAEGILFELVDMTAFKEAFRYKEEFFAHANFHLSEDLSFMQERCEQMNDPDLGAVERATLHTSLRSDLDSIIDFLEQLEGYIDYELDSDSSSPLPVNPRTCLNIAVRQYDSESGEKYISCDVLECAVHSLVFCEPDELVALLKSLLTVLMEDAVENSSLTAEIAEDEAHVLFVMHNTGFGIPNDRLHEYLFSESPTAPNTFQKIRKQLHWVDKWKAEFEACSEIGVGLKFILHLRKFQRLGSMDPQGGEACPVSSAKLCSKPEEE